MTGFSQGLAYFRDARQKAFSKPQIRVEGKAKPDEKAEHT
jgi:hypothetical protein